MNFQNFRWHLVPPLVVAVAGAVIAAKHPVVSVPRVKPAAPVPVLPVQETLKPIAPTLPVHLEKPIVIKTRATAAPFTLTASIESSTAEGQPAIARLVARGEGVEIQEELEDDVA